MYVSSKCFGVTESCVLYLATALRLKMDKSIMIYGDQSINTTVLTGVSVQTKQIEHIEMKPSCRCRKEILLGTSVYHDYYNALL